MSAAPPSDAFERAKIEQRRAADPTRSVWVSANAGAGKTRVLVDRVTRLLLDGARPHAILCLTFTKAAAAEMRARLAQRLGRWAAVDEATLQHELADIADARLGASPAVRARARELFAATLDAPGGLRVQTIHSFCESLLNRFPLEAGLGVQFTVADELATAALLEEARARLLASAEADPVVAASLQAVVGQVDAQRLEESLDALVGERRRVRRLLARHGGDPERVIDALRAELGVGPGDTVASIDAAFVAALPREAMRHAAAVLEGGGKTDALNATMIASCLADRDLDEHTGEWLSIFLTQKDEPRADSGLASSKATKRDPGVLEAMRAEATRCLAHVERRRAVGLAAVSAAMIRLGARLMDLYAEAKRGRAVLDYDDLILRSLDLLQGVDQAWVRYKLDGGIDHILVDEAQDTSAEQWQLIEILAEEFFAGEGTRGAAPRTLFAVGDEKQSIFSFQGADPQAFQAMRTIFAAVAENGSRRFDVVDLPFSFRSAPTVLGAVDALFADPRARDGVAAAATSHVAVRERAPGRVELWPLIVPPDRPEEKAWDAPLDYQSTTSPPAGLARRIADTIAGWLDSGECLAEGEASIRAGDVMILVRRRNAFFVEMVRALKERHVPVAGADRLVLAEHIAVLDLVALGHFALLPEDDHSLACVLKSPLFGLDDDDLFALCHGRDGTLWSALRARAAERPAWQAAAAHLGELLGRADRMPPFEFYARLLGADGGRAKFLARLGHEAADPLDEFLSLALGSERDHVPSLEGFLHRLERGGAEIKRDMEQARDEVRVMTVHAAKGLEAPIVFLPDTASAPDHRQDPALFWPEASGSPLLLWPARKSNEAALSRGARAEVAAARLAEYRRLLYVATTRAKDRLYVCGWRGQREASPECWHAMVERTLRADPRVVEVALWPDEPPALRLESGAPPSRGQARPPAPIRPMDLPDWAQAPATAEPRPPRPLAPSALPVAAAGGDPLGGAAVLAARRGRVLHRLLEMLPAVAPAARAAAAGAMVERALRDAAPGQRAALVDETLAVLAAVPDLFDAGSRAEVPIAGLVGDQTVVGQIDRLVVRPTEILILDYKSSRSPPDTVDDVPPAFVIQLALYRALVQRIYPDRNVRALVLWTTSPRLMELPAAALDRALKEHLTT
ncbi:MAG: double-strand break repair helicase AddA [Alphaproteobacteria bacterium]|nr:double-strand break repair helicase AddA [Alphaproteobacteria bacterium]